MTNSLSGRCKDKLGFLGTSFASLCCLRVSLFIAPLTAIGLGSLINNLLLLPLVLVFLLITLWGLYNGWRRHDERRPFFLGIFRRGVITTLVFSERLRCSSPACTAVGVRDREHCGGKVGRGHSHVQ